MYLGKVGKFQQPQTNTFLSYVKKQQGGGQRAAIGLTVPVTVSVTVKSLKLEFLKCEFIERKTYEFATNFDFLIIISICNPMA